VFHVDHDLSIPLRPVTGKAFKSMVSGAVKFQKTFLSSITVGKGEAVRISRLESSFRSNSRQGEAHAELPDQAISADCANGLN